MNTINIPMTLDPGGRAMGRILPSDMKYVSKAWGYEVHIVNTEKYCGKILFIRNSRKCSFHYHKLKDEVLYVTKGTCRFKIHDPSVHTEGCFDTFDLKAGEAWHVKPGLIHQMTAIDGDVEIFEVSTQHFDEDSIRVEVGST